MCRLYNNRNGMGQGDYKILVKEGIEGKNIYSLDLKKYNTMPTFWSGYKEKVKKSGL